jgi:tetratricopeptide (TPR) repeat protein
MGQVLFALEDYLNAEQFLEQAIQTDSSFAPAFLHLGQTYLVTNKPVLAEEALRKVLELAPASPESKFAQRLIDQYFNR